MTNPTGKDDPPKYRAPALAKGLEILRLLSNASRPYTLSAMSEELSRSRSEIFRMVQELEIHNFIAKSETGDGYEITNQLFLLGMSQPKIVTIVEAALPVMRAFVNETIQSCHLAIAVDAFIVVLARTEAPGPVSLSVRVGHRQSIFASTSGHVIYALQPEDVQKTWIRKYVTRGMNAKAINETAKQVRERGFLSRPSNFMHGVTDISAPIRRGPYATAALTSPYVNRIASDENAAPPYDALCRAAAEISSKLIPT